MTPSVGKSLPHDSAHGHVTGQALFLDDVRPLSGELVVGLVGSPVACGRLEEVDTTVVLGLPDEIVWFTASDIPGRNSFGGIVADEPLLASNELLYLGQPVAIIAAPTSEALERGRQAVRIVCAEEKPLLTIEESIRAERFLGPLRRIARGDVDAHLAQATHRLQGELTTGGQEQFYLESQGAIAYPAEQGQLVIHSSTQNPTEVQAIAAEVLGLRQHKIVCLCKRMGGAFGGKESQSTIPAVSAALVALKTGQSARLIYDKTLDMRITGKRHQYLARWDVGFDDQGRIVALRTEFFSNGGAATDLSPAILERTLMHADNAYYLPHVELTGRICFTNLPPNTAFRGFGGPQAMVVIENILETIAQHLQLDAFEIRKRNLYGGKGRCHTPYGQQVVHNHLPEIVDQLAERSDYTRRRREIDTLNAQSSTELRGLAMTAMKFGISFTTQFLNQGNALVNVYTDGSIQISSGATEMGQGIQIKLKQIAADVFGLAPDSITVMPTSTEKNNNTSPTAASSSADLNGWAVQRACEKIKKRLAQFAAEQLHGGKRVQDRSSEDIQFVGGQVLDRQKSGRTIDFGTLCDQARRARIDLGARGFYATPGINFDRDAGRGNPFFYFTQGAAVAEVRIDRFTGELSTARVDLLIDIGKSINPAVDRGQILGGFIQGMGWVTSEALIYDQNGALLTDSPTTYKIPAVRDLPDRFEINMFDTTDNMQNIYRSKAVGEPPLMLGIAVWTAVKNGLGYLAPGRAVGLQLPATGEEILRCIMESDELRG